MATKENDAVSAVDNSDEHVFIKSEEDANYEDVFACTKSLLEATKFDNGNVSHDSESMEETIENLFMFKLWIWSQLHRIVKWAKDNPEAKKTKR